VERFVRVIRRAGAAGGVAAGLAGCMTSHPPVPVSVPADIPRELRKVSLPDYTLEPPDILQVDLIAAVPKPPYRVQPLDALAVRVPNALPDAPVAGVYPVGPDGTVDLGAAYGAADVRGLTLDEAKKRIAEQLAKTVKDPAVEVSLAQTRGVQQVRGPHLVRPDGTVGLGTYGPVRVVGMTLPEAKRAIEGHLKQYFQDPEVSVEVAGYNSKVYYVVYDGGGQGQQVARLPATGNETVLDAVGQLNGLTTVSDARRMWVSRPAPDGGCQVLPVDWRAITEAGDTATNYQLLPGDRVFVSSYPLTRFDTRLARLLAPAERAFGFTLLGAGTVQQLQFRGNGNGVGGFGAFR
jgi:polysaccharide export outer membrane protein